MKRDFQKTVRRELDLRCEVNPVSCVRFRFERWNLPGFPGRTAERFVRALSQLKEHLPPQGVCSYFANGLEWVVHEASLPEPWRMCLWMWCFLQADSVEHYSGCRVCVGFLRSRLRYLEPIDRGHLVVLGVHQTYPGLGTLLRLALWNYVLYRSFNHCRHLTGPTHTSSSM